MFATVYFEIYVLGPTGEVQQIWRRSDHECPPPLQGVPYALYNRHGQRWMFPSQGAHWDTKLDVYVVWMTVNEPSDYEHLGFTVLDPSRWNP